MNENILSKLHDIKELENIPDNSIFIFPFLIFIGISILLIILFFVIKFFRNKKQSDRKKYYKILQEIDFKDSKSSAYIITITHNRYFVGYAEDFFHFMRDVNNGNPFCFEPVDNSK